MMKEGGPAIQSVVVPLVTLDGFLTKRNSLTPVSFIKIDVQGYELAVCHGAEQTLAQNPDCTLALEYAPDSLRELGYGPADLFPWFEQRGYAAYVIHKNGSVTSGRPDSLGTRGYADLLFTRRAL